MHLTNTDMTKAGQPASILAVLSRNPEEITACLPPDWRVVALSRAEDSGSVDAARAVLIDLREGVPASLEALRPLAGVPYIALLGPEEGPADALLDIGVTHFLDWPVSRGVLEATLKAACAVADRLRAVESAVWRSPGDETDALTGLASRPVARAWLDARLGARGGGVSACLLIGISQFDSVNAAYGKSAGDSVLAAIAGRIERCLGRTATGQHMVARMGGTEYLVACSNPAAVDPTELARHLLAEVARPFLADGQVIRLTARCGIALPVAEDDASRLLRRASAALSDARRSATSEVITRSGKRRRAGGGPGNDLDRLDADLRLALEGGEIGIVYQPQYDSHSDRILGVEALARWNHPRLGRLDAATLFEAADRSDYLLPLSRHIQRTALAEAGRWPETLGRLRLSINVTAADLAQEDFVSGLLAIIEESGFPRDRLTVEITETGLIENIERAAALLRDLRRNGLSVAIDDFGTGYSSLAYLKALHPDYLKIDHSLSRDIVGTPRDRVIVRAIIAMARSLALTVIAEGVESEEQLTLLAREGCDIYQGFLRSPAVTSQELDRICNEDRGS